MGSPAILQVGFAELADQELHAFEAIASVGEAGVREEADHRLIDLHAIRRFGTIRRHCALAPLRGDRARAVGDDESQEHLEREELLRRRRFAEQRQVSHFRGSPAVDHVADRNAAEGAVLMLGCSRPRLR